MAHSDARVRLLTLRAMVASPLSGESATALLAVLAPTGFAVEVTGRAKHLFSIHQKLRARGERDPVLHDLFGTGDVFKSLKIFGGKTLYAFQMTAAVVTQPLGVSAQNRLKGIFFQVLNQLLFSVTHRSSHGCSLFYP